MVSPRSRHVGPPRAGADRAALDAKPFKAIEGGKPGSAAPSLAPVAPASGEPPAPPATVTIDFGGLPNAPVTVAIGPGDPPNAPATVANAPGEPPAPLAPVAPAIYLSPPSPAAPLSAAGASSSVCPGRRVDGRTRSASTVSPASTKIPSSARLARLKAIS